MVEAFPCASTQLAVSVDLRFHVGKLIKKELVIDSLDKVICNGDKSRN
jgi:hypothetical protein